MNSASKGHAALSAQSAAVNTMVVAPASGRVGRAGPTMTGRAVIIRVVGLAKMQDKIHSIPEMAARGSPQMGEKFFCPVLCAQQHRMGRVPTSSHDVFRLRERDEAGIRVGRAPAA